MFARLNYTEAELCSRFNLQNVVAFKDIDAGREEGPVLDGFDALVRLFMDMRPLNRSRACELIGLDDVSLLESIGLLRQEGPNVQASVLLYPVVGLYFISDLPSKRGAADARPDVVFPALSVNTERFLGMLPQAASGDFLELCAGTGVAALLAARNGARHVWATDIAERSVRFSEFNAALNQIENFTASAGDLYEAVAGRTFDEIVAHPPYVPAKRQEFVYRDGGEDGEQVTRGIIEGAPAYLRPGGCLRWTALMSDRSDALVEQRIRAMLGERETDFDVFVGEMHVLKPAEYYLNDLNSGRCTHEQLAEGCAALSRAGVERLVYCTCVAARHDRPSPPLTLRRQLVPGAGAPHFEWALERERVLNAEGSLERLLDSHPVASPDITMVVLHHFKEGRWVPGECAFRRQIPFIVEAQAQPWAAPLLGRFDGKQTLREHLKFLMQQHVVKADAPPLEFAAFIRQFVAGGFVDTELSPPAPKLLSV